MLPLPSHHTNLQGHPPSIPPTPSIPPIQNQIAHQQTLPVPAITAQPPGLNTSALPIIPSTKPKQKYTRILAAALVLALAVTIYFIWRSSPTPTPSSSTVTQQNFSNAAAPKGTTSSDLATGQILVYIVGAVKHPGVYTLPAGARVYQLLEAAGGPLSNANLVALNLAAKLIDGQEVYVVAIGETPPTYQGGVPGTGSGTVPAGQLININTATTEELRLGLHISSTTAQKIVDYRTQHGPFTSVDQLLQVVSKTTYDKIKDQVTI
jgi:competence protein ComEA